MMQRCMQVAIMLLAVAAASAVRVSAQSSSSTGAAAPFVPPATLTVGFVGSLTLPNTNAISSGQPSLLSFKLALARINADPSILPNTQLVGAICDSKSDASEVIAGTFNLINSAQVVGIVGEAQSSMSQYVAYVAKPYKLTQVSFGSSSTDFTEAHSKTYPFFARPLPHVRYEAIALTAFIKDQGWTRFAIVSTTDSYGSAGQAAMVATAQSLGLTVLATVAYDQGIATLQFQVQQLIDSGARIIAYWGVIGDLLLLWNVAATMTPNICGESYQWLAGHSVVIPSLYTNSSGSIVQKQYTPAQGLLGSTYAVDWSAPEGQLLWTAWQASGPLVASTPQLSSVSTTGSSPLDSISTYASLAYDATRMLALALHDMIEVQQRDPRLLSNRQQLYNTLLNVTFTGVTGFVQLDSKGDRLPAPFDISNLQAPASAGAKPAFAIVARVASDLRSVTAVAPIQYHGSNPSVQPVDTPPRLVKRLSTGVTLALEISCSLILLGCLLTIGWIVAHRDLPVVRAASPVFLVCVVLGAMMLCTSVFARSVESEVALSSHDSCLADLFLSNLGYTLLIGSLLVKTFRLRLIFLANTLKQIRAVQDSVLGAALLVLLGFEALMLMALQLSRPLSVELRYHNALSDVPTCTAVGDPSLVSLYLPVTITVRFVLIVVTAVVAFQVRDIPDRFNETKQLFLAIYNLAFLSILLPLIDASMTRGTDTALVAYCVCVFGIVVLSVAILLAPIVVHSYTRTLRSRVGRFTAAPASVHDSDDSSAPRKGPSHGNSTIAPTGAGDSGVKYTTHTTNHFEQHPGAGRRATGLPPPHSTNPSERRTSGEAGYRAPHAGSLISPAGLSSTARFGTATATTSVVHGSGVVMLSPPLHAALPTLSPPALGSKEHSPRGGGSSNGVDEHAVLSIQTGSAALDGGNGGADLPGSILSPSAADSAVAAPE